MTYLKKFKTQMILILSISFLVCAGVFGMNMTANAKDNYPYYIKVNKQQNTVTIYEKDDLGKYTVPVKAMTCSVGNATPLGIYKTPIKYRWKLLNGNVWGQYSTRIVGGILFHSVYYYKKEDPSTLSWAQYNRLGTTASQGCVRLTVEDAKWIYDNCPIGTGVEIYNGKEPGPLGKPETMQLKSGTGWDPTDPNKDNPFNGKTPSIKGAKNITVDWGGKVDLKTGVTALSTTGFDITSKMVIEGEVDVYTLGKQKVTYTVTDVLGRAAKKTITVTVKESKEPPKLTGVKDRGIAIDQIVDREFALTGVKAYLASKELPAKSIKVDIKEKEDGYQITYSITGANNLTTTEKAYFYKDSTAPFLSGISHRELTKDQLSLSKSKLKTLALKGVSVTDDYSSLTEKDIQVTVKAKGDYAYTVTYHVSDEAGNEAEEIVQFTYFDDVRIEGVSNVYNLPYGTKVTKALVREGIFAFDSEGNDITDDMAVTVSSYVNEVYKVTYKITDEEDKVIGVVAYFTVMLEPETSGYEEELGEEYEETEEILEESIDEEGIEEEEQK